VKILYKQKKLCVILLCKFLMCISQETLGDTVHLGEERRRLRGKTKAS